MIEIMRREEIVNQIKEIVHCKDYSLWVRGQRGCKGGQ